MMIKYETLINTINPIGANGKKGIIFINSNETFISYEEFYEKALKVLFIRQLFFGLRKKMNTKLQHFLHLLLIINTLNYFKSERTGKT